MSFEWQKEETGWDDVPPVEEPTAEGGQRRWPWVVGLVLALLLVAALLVYRQVNQRINMAMEQAEADLLASYEIVYTAALAGDRELFTSFVSGRDPQWAAAQEQAIRKGIFFDRRTFGLTWLPGEGQTAVVETTISPNLQAAEVISEQPYAIDIGSGLTETVRLQHTAAYRLGPNRWLFSPPEPEFWGETRHSQGRILTLIYPQRDEMIARRLALDIDAKLMEMCAALAELECLEDLRVSSALTTDPGSLNEATLANTLVRAGETLELPAPTLVGTPVDEAAYQALYRGYATHVVAAAITDLVGWRCCGQAHFYQALLAQQLRRLALRPLPLTSGDYEALTQLNLEELADTWSGTDILEQIDGAKPHLALAQFLIEESGASATTMQRVLAQVNSASEAAYWGWLFQFAGGENSNREALEREWFRFVYNRSTTAQTPPPLPWPEQDLQLLCRPVTGQTLALYRYDLVADSLTFATTLERPVAFMIGLTDDRGVVVGEYQSAGARESLYLWENGVKKRILWDSSASVPVALPVTTDPEGRLLLMYSPLEASTPAGLLPLADCRAGADCALTVLNGFPIWSPAGERAVIVVGDLAFTSGGRLQGNLFLSDGNGEDSHFLGLGATPFWLDNETFGFVTLDPELLRQSIYTVTVGNATVEPTLLLAVDELAAVLPESQESGSLHLDYVAVTPTDPDLLLIASADPSGQASGGYLFTFDRETEKVSLHLEIEDEPRLYQRGYRFSPDGRWLLISSLNNVDPIWVLYLHNVEGGDTLTFTVNDTYPLPLHWYTDWSADNQWLSLPERGHVRLIAPDHDYEHLVIPEDRVCSGAVWVNKE